MKTIWTQVANSTGYPNSCAVMYDVATKRLSLVKDDATGWLPSITIGAASTVQNSQCTVDASASTAVSAGNNLTLGVAYTFKAGYSGTKNIYGRAMSVGNLDSGWQLKGTWSPFAPLAEAPTVTSVTPNSAAGPTNTLQFAFSSVNGFTDIKTIWTQVAVSTGYAGSCALLYDTVANKLQLVKDDASGWLPGITPGTAVTVQNSQCSISGAGTSVSGSGNDLNLRIAYTMKPGYTGAKNVYGRAQNQAGLNSNWQLQGVWILP
jgi:hypothetical protein